MDDNVEEFEPLVNRLRAFGEAPVPQATAARVLGVAHAPGRVSLLRSTKLKVAAGIAGGFMAGNIGFASAGTLPAPAQDVAHAALSVVGVNVPPGHDRYTGPECGGAKNHGQYVGAHPNDPNAAKSNCGKPMNSVNHPDGTTATTAKPDATETGKPDGTDHGKPADAGSGKPSAPGNSNGSGKPADAGSGKPPDAGHGKPADTGNSTSANHQHERPTSTTASSTTTTAP